MKRCPKCNLNYTDNTMEFCLEDGSRLLSFSLTETETVVRGQDLQPGLQTEKTVNLPTTPIKENFLTDQPKLEPEKTKPAGLIDPVLPVQSTRIIEMAPIVIALAHNWWQWVYLNNQYYYSFGSYVLSANFLMWLLLLVSGAVVGLLALKKSTNKSFAVTSLVVLAINLLLFLVPKR